MMPRSDKPSPTSPPSQPCTRLPISAEQAAARLHEALSARELVEQAKGVIAYTENIDMGAAYEALLARAGRCGQTLTQVAQTVIEDQQRQPRAR